MKEARCCIIKPYLIGILLIDRRVAAAVQELGLEAKTKPLLFFRGKYYHSTKYMATHNTVNNK